MPAGSGHCRRTEPTISLDRYRRGVHPPALTGRASSGPTPPGPPRPVAVPPLRAATVFAATLLAATVLASCQTKAPVNREPRTGATTASASGGVQTVVITTDSRYRFTPATITVHPGKVRITLEHTGTGGAPHDWQLQGLPAAFVPLTSAGQTRSVEFTAPAPGRYTFICTIHVNQGQTGTLVVLGT
jgi:plastocyanin